jgi:hypothetical protein
MKKLLILILALYVVVITTANAGWTYLAPNYDWFGYRDRSGVLHAWQADEARYDRSTKTYEVLINGEWWVVGEDVERISN